VRAAAIASEFHEPDQVESYAVCFSSGEPDGSWDERTVLPVKDLLGKTRCLVFPGARRATARYRTDSVRTHPAA